MHANTQRPERSNSAHPEILGRALGHAVTDPTDKQECVEAVSRAFIREEKLLRFISPAAILFSKEMRQRYCCYSNSRATRQPILHRGAALGGRLFQSYTGGTEAVAAEYPFIAP